MEAVKLAEVIRGELVESVHYGVVAVVDSEGKVLASAGDPGQVSFIRSAAKPMQAVPVVERGAADHYGLSPEELAFLCSSHSGEEEHERTLHSILNKIQLRAEHLLCGTHPPLNRARARALALAGQEPTVFHCSCSGKHVGMLALARHMGWVVEEYYRLEHPVQQEMLQSVAVFAGLDPSQIPVGVDGCGVPVFAMPVERMARAYARFVNPAAFPEEKRKACQRLQEAMTTYPHQVAGTGRLATELMKICGTRFVAKDGAEGVFCLGVVEKGWGIAVKIADGHSRAMGPVVVSLLEQLGLLQNKEKELLSPHKRVQVKNLRREVIGEIRPAFSLV